MAQIDGHLILLAKFYLTLLTQAAPRLTKLYLLSLWWMRKALFTPLPEPIHLQHSLRICIYMQEPSVIFKLFSKLKIEKNDLRFFFPLATVSGILMESFSWLPERINRDYFSAIIYDHLPWTTIGTIFVLQVLLALFHHSIRYEKTKNYTHDIIQHICIKIQHFCSPAFSVLMGLSLACTVMAAIKNSHHYLNHSIAFGYFSLFFLIIPWTSIYLEKSIDAQLSQPTTALLKVIGLTALAGVLIFPLLNQNPITVEFKLSLAEHYLVKKALSGEESVWEFAKKSTIKNASSHVHALELNDN